MQNKTMEDWSWYYASQGFSIIPLQEKEKIPNIPTWKDYSIERPQPTEIQKWLDEGLFKNIGVVCGHVSNDLVVIDIDDKNIITELNVNLKNLIEKGYWVVETARGYHIYMMHTEDPGDLRKEDKLHIEYRSNLGYVVAPPSTHPTGKKYAFLNESLEPLKKKDAKAIFDKWVEALQEKHGVSVKATKPIQMSNIEADCIRNVFKGGLSEGRRNDTAFCLTNWYRDVKKMNPTEIRALVKNWNERNKEPLPDRELSSIITSSLKSEKSTGCNRWKQLGFCPYENKKDCSFIKPKKQMNNQRPIAVKPILEKPELKTELLQTFGAVWKDDNDKIRVNCPQLAKLLMEADNEHYLVTNDNLTILRYNGSYFDSKGEHHIANRINYYCDALTSNRIKSETLGFIKNNKYVDRDELEQPLNLLNFKNGILDITTGELISHDPKNTFLFELPVDFNKDAKCPNWEKFIDDIIYPEDKQFLQETCGYLLYRRYAWALLLILLGHGRNGKTTFINVMSQILGKKNVTHIPLQTIAHDQPAKAKLYQIHANLCSEIGSREVKDTGAIKQLTGGDRIYARELYKEGFDFENYAKLYFACNILPEIDDKTLAMIERLAVIEFPNTFKRDDPECDPDIINKLTTPDELSGIINWMIAGLNRLLEQKNFSPYKDFTNISEYQKKCQDQIFQFISLELEHAPDATIKKAELYTHYKTYCETNKLIPLNDVWFGRKLLQFVPVVWHVASGQRIKHTWNGIKIKAKSGVEETLRPYEQNE